MSMELNLDEIQQEALLAEVTTLLAGIHEPEARSPWEALSQAVAAGAVGEPLLGPLERLLDMSLQTGRARRLHGPESEQALLRLFHRTPRGAAARRATEAVNEALHGLAGQTLEEMLFTVQGPGVFRLGLRTDRCRLTLEVDRHGVDVESLEV
jgi:hypothetical protein